MKKVLLSILALMLCVSMFAGCGTALSDALEALPQESSSNNTGNVEEAPAVKVLDKKTAIDAFNKIDLTAFAGVSFDSMAMLEDLTLQAEFEMSGIAYGEEGFMKAGIQMKDNVYHIITEEGANAATSSINEMFQLTDGTTATIYHKYTDNEYPEISTDWEMITADESNTAGSPADAITSISSMNPEMITDTLAKIQIPKLEEDDITDVDGMALISNEYIVDFVAANLSIVYGDSLDDEMIKEAREELTKSLEDYKFALYFDANEAGITKMAVSIDSEETGKIYGEIALTDDCKALKSFTLKATHNFGGAGLEYAPESSLVIKPIYADVTVEEETATIMVGADLDIVGYVASRAMMAEPDVSEGDDTAETYTVSAHISKMVIDATINLSNIGKTDADIATLKFETNLEKVINYEYKYTDDGEEEMLSATEDTEATKDAVKSSINGTLKSVNPSKINLDLTVAQGEQEMKITANLNYVIEDDTITCSGDFTTPDLDLEFEAAVSFADFTMPDLPQIAE